MDLFGKFEVNVHINFGGSYLRGGQIAVSL